MIGLASGWEICAERGPGWLFVRLKPGNEMEPPEDLAEAIWELMQEHMVVRVTVELDEVRLLDSRLLGQLAKLAKRVRNCQGLLRLCGLSPFNRQLVALNGLDGILPAYCDRRQAVMAHEPRRPR